jgi:dynein heavy chain
MGEPTAYDTLNPKAVENDELFGNFNKAKEWKNGIIAVIMTCQNKNEE